MDCSVTLFFCIFAVLTPWERRTIHFRDTTLRGYSGTFRTLNGERLPFSHLKVSNGR